MEESWNSNDQDEILECIVLLGALEWLMDTGIDDYCLMSMSSSNDDEYWMTCMRNLNDDRV